MTLEYYQRNRPNNRDARGAIYASRHQSSGRAPLPRSYAGHLGQIASFYAVIIVAVTEVDAVDRAVIHLLPCLGGLTNRLFTETWRVFLGCLVNNKTTADAEGH
jgi:hypothetical protein